MAKPSITKRSTKGAALTYSELDANFQNLADATLSLTAGSGGQQVTVDLNGNITLVAGSGVTLTGDNTAKTITITSTGGGGLTNPLTADLDCGSYLIKDTNSEITLKSTQGLKVLSNIYSSNANVTITPGTDGAGALAAIDAGFNRALTIRTNTSTGVMSFLTLDDGGGYISASSSNSDYYFAVGTSGSGVIKLSPTTTAQRDARTTVADGMIIYNSSTNKFQGRANGSWVDLH